MARVTHFEIHADDPLRAVSFYEKCFGWKIEKWNGPFDYWLATTGDDNHPGINGAIMQRRGKKYDDMAVIGYVCTVELADDEDIDEKQKVVLENGGTIAVEKNYISGIGYQTYFKDPEGNIIGVHKPDTTA